MEFLIIPPALWLAAIIAGPCGFLIVLVAFIALIVVQSK